MPATPVSAALKQLLEQQKNEQQMLRTQYDQQKAQQEQQYRQQSLWQRQQQAAQQRSMQQTQRQHRDTLHQWSKSGSSLPAVLTAMKQRYTIGGMSREPDWKRFSPEEKSLLEKIAKAGGTAAEAESSLLALHRRRQAKQSERQQRQTLGTRQAQQGLSLTLAEQHRNDVLTMRRRQRGESDLQKERDAAQQRRRESRQAVPGRAIGLAQAATHIGRALQNPFMSQERQAIEFGHALGQMGGKIGLVGEAIASFVELKRVVDGTALSLMQLRLGVPHVRLFAQERGQRQTLQDVQQLEVGLQRARAQEYRTLGAAGGGVTRAGQGLVAAAGQRNTFQGEIEYRAQAAAFPHRIAVAKAQAEVNAARKAREAAESQVQGHQRNFRAHEMLANEAGHRLQLAYQGQNRFNIPGLGERTWGNEQAITEANLRRQQAVDNASVARENLEAAINREKDIGVTLAEKELRLEQAKVQVLAAQKQARLAQYEQIQAHGATAIGSMGIADQMRAGVALNMLKGGMPLNLMPAQFKSMLQQVAPEFMRKQYEQTGMKSDIYRQYQEAGLIPKGDLNQTRRQLAEVNAQVQVSISINEAKFIEKLADAIDRRFKQLLDMIEAKFRIEHQRIDTGQHIQHAG